MLGKYLHMADFPQVEDGSLYLGDEVQRTTSIGVSVQSLLLDLGTSNTNKLYCSSNSVHRGLEFWRKGHPVGSS